MQGYEVVAVTTRAGKTQTGPPQKEKQTCHHSKQSCNDPAGIGCVNRCEPKKYKFATYEICDSADPYRGNKAQLW